ncbi:MAG: hypothetical protein KKD48_01530 [Nanoarchaeota archaeon]|nr:hypothetical protein [Nanoarchaeota archaeon]
MKNKRAQESGSAIAVLVLLIALFMLLYVLLLPPEQREDILNQTISKNGDSNQINPVVLLSESPGELFPNKEGNIKHDISSLNIFVKDEPQTNRLANALEISRSLFSSKPQTVTFQIDDLTNIKSVILFFSVAKASGNLQIWLNDNIVLDKKVEGVQTIELPTNYLKRNNILELKVSGPGLLFFTKNSYELEDIGIKETFEVINPKEERIFTISETEKAGLQKAILKYQIYCNGLDNGNTDFKILLNDKQVISKIISCIGGSEEVELPNENIKEGTNKLTFIIGEGDFLLSQINVETELKEKSNPTYHFDINNDDYDNIINGGADVTLRITGAKTKKANLIINDKKILMDTSEDTFSKDIRDYVNEGDNFIKIIPINTFTMDLLEVKIQ